MEHFYTDECFGTENMFTAETLYEQVVREAVDGAVFVELGTHRGRSAAYMGVEIANSGKRIEFTTVDIHPSLYMSATKNLKPLIDGGYVRTKLSDSVDMASSYADGSVDFVYLDAGHTAPEVSADIDAWRPKIKPGGMMAGDDFWWTDLKEPVIDPNAPKFGNWQLRPSFPVHYAVHQKFPVYNVLVTKNWAKWWVRL